MAVPAYLVSDTSSTPRLALATDESLQIQKDGSTKPHFWIDYMNEGGANFVFTFRKAEAGGVLPDPVKSKLLRLRKDHSHLPSAQKQYDDFSRHIKPSIPEEHLVEQELVELDAELVRSLDAALKSSNHSARRKDHALPIDELKGFLVTDMTPEKKDREVLLEAKPKWLAQSPNAPSGSRRCRTCALRAQRAASGLRTATDAQENCPLALISSNVDLRLACARKLTEDAALVSYLVNEAQPLLCALRDEQTRFDTVGVKDVANGRLSGGDHDERDLSLCKAMTLRDCTFFVLKRADGTFEARFADLDLKRADKIPKWCEVESALIDGGWYADPSSVGDVKENVCLLATSH